MNDINMKDVVMNLRWNLIHLPSFRNKIENKIEDLNESLIRMNPKLDELDFENRELVLLMAELVVKYRKEIELCKKIALEDEVDKVTFKLYQQPNESKMVVTLRFFFVKDKFWKTNSIVLKEGFPVASKQEKPLRFYTRKIRVVPSHLIDQGKVLVRHLKNQRSKYTLKGEKQTRVFILSRNKQNKLVIIRPSSAKYG